MFEKLLASFAPKKGIKVLVSNMETTVGHPVEKFELRIFVEENKIDFLIYLPSRIDITLLPPATAVKYNNDTRSHLYKYKDGEKLAKLISYMASSKLPDTYKLDFIIAKYDGENGPIICETYGVNNGQKEKQTLTF